MAAAGDGFPRAGRTHEQQESPRAGFRHFKLNQARVPTERVSPQIPQGAWIMGQIQLEISSAWEALGRRGRNAGAGLCSGQVLAMGGTSTSPTRWALSPPGDSRVNPGQLCRVGATAVPRGHPVCATRLRSLTLSANTGSRLLTCLGGLGLMFCRSRCSQGC